MLRPAAFLLASSLLLPQAASAGDDLLWYSGNSGAINLATRSPTEVSDAAANLGVNYVETASWPVDLSVYRVIFLGVPEATFSGPQEADMAAFVAGGGVLVLVSDAAGYASANPGVLNTLLGNLGYSSSFGSASLDGGCGKVGTTIGVGPLTAGVTGWSYAYSNEAFTGAGAQRVIQGVSGQGLVVVEGSVVLVADSSPFMDSCTLPAANTTFVENLWDLGVPQNCDADGDGYDLIACGGTDCNDGDALVNPGAVEVGCDGLDNDCNPVTPDGADADGDGVNDCTDCDDNDADNFPGNVESCDGVDNNCDGAADEGLPSDDYWVDDDGDGYGAAGTLPVTDCALLPGYATNDLDCDDTTDQASPAGVEQTCDGLDNDCDPATVDDRDLDGDGDGQCTDCDDSDPLRGPSLPEECDDIDHDCDGTVDNGLTFADYWADGDGDGYGAGAAVNACRRPSGHAPEDGDCDDANPEVNPGALEVADNGVDENCDGIDSVTSGATSQSLGCGCDGTGSGGAGWLLVGLLGLARRRR